MVERNDSKRRVWRRAIVAGWLFALALVAISWSQVWFSVNVIGAATGVANVTTDGSHVRPVIVVLVLADLACLSALFLSRAIVRVVLICISVAIGGGIVVAIFSALSNPISGLADVVGKATGLTGEFAISDVTEGLNIRVWPYLALAGGVIVVVASLGGLLVLRDAVKASSRYEPIRKNQPELIVEQRDWVQEWDRLDGDGDKRNPKSTSQVDE
ncbi:MAG: Trp biosynthesis-associated membrane protein [Microbacteriaceae bacterium]|nr:Trp biosynthesis-associated membrane protein [Microbacteriaceae bacterium]